MIELAIVEDEKDSREVVKTYAKLFADERKIPITVSEFPDGIDILEDYSVGRYDIILCDIKMKYMDGIKTTEQIRKIDSDVLIIFITNIDSYAIHGYEIGALGYLLKPMKYTSFCMFMDRAVTLLNARVSEVLTIQCKGGILRLAIKDINYIEHHNHFLEIHVGERIESIRMPLGQMENSLKNKNFSKCNRGCLVNLSKVIRVEGNNVLVKNQWLQIGSTRKNEFMKELTLYLGREQI